MNGTTIPLDPFGVNEDPDNYAPVQDGVVGAKLKADLAQARTLPALLAIMRTYVEVTAANARLLRGMGRPDLAQLCEVESMAVAAIEEAIRRLPDDPEPCGPGRIARWLFRRVA